MSDNNKAPVVELVVGIQFERPVITNECIYEYYVSNKDKYPNIQENPILPSFIEHVDRPLETGILSGFHSRKYLISKDDDRLIQLQPNRLLFNWRKGPNNAEYPKFKNVYDQFVEIRKSIDKKCNFNNLINQLEVTFFDQIVLKDFGLENHDLGKIFNFWKLSKSIKHVDFNFTIPYPDLQGNLNVKLRSAIRNSDNEKLLMLETTLRGINSQDEKIDSWFNRAHNVLSSFFMDILTENAKKIWGL